MTTITRPREEDLIVLQDSTTVTPRPSRRKSVRPGPERTRKPRTERGLAGWSPRRLRLLLVVALLLTVGAGVLSAGTIASLKAGGFDDPSSDSVAAASALNSRFDGPEPNLVVVVDREGATPDARDVADVGERVTARLRAAAGVTSVRSYWDARDPSLRSDNGRYGLVVGRVSGDEDASAKRVAVLHDELASDGPVEVKFGGLGQINNDINDQVTRDLALAESIAIPITLVLLVLVFGGVVAASLPLGVGIMAIVGTLGALRILAEITDVSVFAVNLTTALGLGLAVDYSLLFVSRYREERRQGLPTREAVRRTQQTAGRTVLFSGLTVTLALAVLLVFPQYFLRSFAYAGIAVVLIAVLVTLTVLPAMVLLLGDRIDKWPLRRKPRGRRRAAVLPADTSWGRVAARVMRRPLLWSVPVVAVLVLAGAPFLSVTFGVPDDRVLPTASESRVTGDVLRDHFGADVTGAVTVVATGWGEGAQAKQDLGDYAASLAQVPGVQSVSTSTGTWTSDWKVLPPGPASSAFVRGPDVWLRVGSEVEPYSEAGKTLARDIRAVPVPDDRAVLVGGEPAQLVDITGSIGDRLPLALALIAGSTYVLLFLLTGSVLLPLKSLVLNVLNLIGIFGAMVWIFQQGHLADVLGFTATPIATAIPVLLFCIAFGLSMDYEVFLVSRIKEFHDEGLDTRQSVVSGLGSNGRIISAAASILAVSFFAMLTSGVSFIQLLGLGAGLAILIDALVIRAVLVPAFMQFAGRANWWAPRPLRALHDRFGLRESGSSTSGRGDLDRSDAERESDRHDAVPTGSLA